MKRTKLRITFNERGQALILVLILLALGSLLILPVLGFATTGLKTSVVFENKTQEQYAADAGVQDALWQIKYDYLDTLFTNPTYNRYDFTSPWTYTTSDNINAKIANVSIQNLWMPKDIATPNATQARSIIEAGKLIVTASNGTSSYSIKVTYYPETGENLTIQKLGIWLPSGFNYVAGSSNIEALSSNITVQPYGGGQAVLWQFNSVPFNSFPGVNPIVSPRIAEVTFRFTSNQTIAPDTVAWIATSGVSDIPFSWDANLRVFKITSRVGNTSISSYTVKAETRLLRTGIAGDYKATGNSLMLDSDHDGIRETLLISSNATVNDIPMDSTVRAAYLYWSAWRSGVIFSDTCENFNNWNNNDAWSISSQKFRGGFYNKTGRELSMKASLDLSTYTPGTVNMTWNQTKGGTLGANDGLDFAFSTDNGSTWGSRYQAFRGNSPTNPFNYAIPVTYNNGFRIKFYLVGCNSSGQYVYLDNITVTTSVGIPDTSIVFKINNNQVSFSNNGTPQQGSQELVASKSQVIENYLGGNPEGFSYVCSKDVTALVKTYSAKAPDPAANHPGNATYTVGGVAGDTTSLISYAGWSLIIVYTGVETQGHALYLFDTFIHANSGDDIDFDNDGIPGGTISGFIVPEQIQGEVNAAKLTAFVGEGDEAYTGDFLAFNAPSSYKSHPQDIPNSYKLWDSTNSTGNSVSNPNNVWNSKSLGMTADGVDVDTFYITWTSGLLHTGDTSAQIDPYTPMDEWNLVYIILAFRSEPRAGGNLSYTID